jgi:hypothetical protein
VQPTGTASRGRLVTAACFALLAGAITMVCAIPRPAPPVLGPVAVDSVAVPLNPRDPSATTVGGFHYAGGVQLTSRQTNQLHELSDLAVTEDGKLTAIGDESVLLEARIVLDEAGRLVGVKDAVLSRLTGEDGKPLTDTALTDAEGVALLPSGDRLVSFERTSRVWLYPKNGSPPRPVPSPQVELPSNGSFEAISADPEAGDDAYVVGAEESGETWNCRVTAPCVKGPTVEKPSEFGLVAMERMPGGGTAYLLRAYDAVRGSRITLEILQRGTAVARMDLALPMTVDNFEGVTSVPRADGTRRFYLLSDDNARSTQRTLLLAFDWEP